MALIRVKKDERRDRVFDIYSVLFSYADTLVLNQILACSRQLCVSVDSNEHIEHEGYCSLF